MVILVGWGARFLVPAPGRDLGRRLRGELLPRPECQDSITASSSAEPGGPIDWRIPSRSHAARNRPAVYSLPLTVHVSCGVLTPFEKTIKGTLFGSANPQ